MTKKTFSVLDSAKAAGIIEAELKAAGIELDVKTTAELSPRAAAMIGPFGNVGSWCFARRTAGWDASTWVQLHGLSAEILGRNGLEVPGRDALPVGRLVTQVWIHTPEALREFVELLHTELPEVIADLVSPDCPRIERAPDEREHVFHGRARRIVESEMMELGIEPATMDIFPETEGVLPVMFGAYSQTKTGGWIVRQRDGWTFVLPGRTSEDRVVRRLPRVKVLVEVIKSYDL